jgi:O-antigen/teichoic acid export membrane protein
VNAVFNVHAESALRVTAPIAFAYALMPLGLQIAQGMDRLHVYSVTSAGAQLLFLTFLLLAVAATSSLGVTEPLGLRGGALLVGGGVLVLWLRPRFGDVRDRLRRILAEVRAYGAQVYLGRLLGIGTYNMDVLMVAGWANARQVALYTLAGAIAAAFGLPVYGMAFALFPRFVHRPTIDARWLAIATAGGVGGLIFLWAVRDPLLRIVFSSRYLGAGRYIVPLAAAQAVRGVTGVYNSFLSAHGRGRDLRNAAIILTGSNLVLNFALIPPFGAYGAAWASLAALVANLGAHVVFYRRGTVGRDAEVS